MSEESPIQQDADHSDASAAGASVGEARKYRKRAQAAEQTLSEMQQELQEKVARLDELEQTIAHLERSSRVDQLLIEADAIDLESARLLTEVAVAEMSEPDVAEAVADLRRRKPFLFRARSRTTGALGARPEQADPAHTAAERAAGEAHATGNRTDLLRYLRLKRRAR